MLILSPYKLTGVTLHNSHNINPPLHQFRIKMWIKNKFSGITFVLPSGSKMLTQEIYSCIACS